MLVETECCGGTIVSFRVTIPYVGTRYRCKVCAAVVHPNTGEVCEDQEAVF